MIALGARLVFLLSVSAYCVSGAKLLGATECTYGPSFWCGSLRNAKQCSAVSHCISSVWEQLELPADNDGVCDICKDMVQQARDTLESNETQEELKAVFDGACRLIPLKEISSECVQLAEEFIPELLETLASQMNPQIVCATAGLCNSVRIDRLLREQNLLDWHPKPTNKKVDVSPKSSEPDAGDCDDCQKFVKDTIQLVQEHSKQELMDHLLSICSALGSISDGCSALVTVNIDGIYDFLANEVDSKSTCELFGMCGDLYRPVPHPVVKANSGDEECDFCVAIAQHWRDVLTSNTTEEQFKEILDGMCQKSGQFKAECTGLVDSYYQPLFTWLMNEFQPKQVCEVVGLCADIKNKAVWTTLHTGPLDADQVLGQTNEISLGGAGSWTGGDESNSYRHQPQLLPRVKLQSSIKVSVAGRSGVRAGNKEACTMCEFTLHFIQVQLQEKSTKEEIEQAVKSVCKYLPNDLNEQCDDYVDAYGDQVIALLQQEIDPSILCPMLGLCPGSGTPAVTNQNILDSSNVAGVGDSSDVSCVACEYIMVQVKGLLANKTNQESVKDALEQVCSLIPNYLSDECNTFVEQNAVEVMELIVAGIVPEQICRLLHFCKDHMGHLPPLASSNQLPLDRLFVPSLGAVQLGKPSLQQGGQSKVCIMCEFAMNVVEKLVLDNSTYIETDIKDLVEQVCIVLPATLMDDCIGFVEQYSDAIVALLINNIHPSAVCKDLSLCKPANLASLMFSGSQVIMIPHAVFKRSTPSSDGSDDLDCVMCRALYYKRQNTADPQQALADFCTTVDVGSTQSCNQIAETLTDAVVGTDVTATCVATNWCPKPSNLIGSQQCTWGPAYWCQSVVHATSCGAIEHCQERQWLGASPPATA